MNEFDVKLHITTDSKTDEDTIVNLFQLLIARWLIEKTPPFEFKVSVITCVQTRDMD